jgi:hypothetical protein
LLSPALDALVPSFTQDAQSGALLTAGGLSGSPRMSVREKVMQRRGTADSLSVHEAARSVASGNDALASMAEVDEESIADTEAFVKAHSARSGEYTDVPGDVDAATVAVGGSAAPKIVLNSGDAVAVADALVHPSISRLATGGPSQSSSTHSLRREVDAETRAGSNGPLPEGSPSTTRRLTADSLRASPLPIGANGARTAARPFYSDGSPRLARRATGDVAAATAHFAALASAARPEVTGVHADGDLDARTESITPTALSATLGPAAPVVQISPPRSPDVRERRVDLDALAAAIANVGAEDERISPSGSPAGERISRSGSPAGERISRSGSPARGAAVAHDYEVPATPMSVLRYRIFDHEPGSSRLQHVDLAEVTDENIVVATPVAGVAVVPPRHDGHPLPHGPSQISVFSLDSSIVDENDENTIEDAVHGQELVVDLPGGDMCTEIVDFAEPGLGLERHFYFGTQL